MKSKYPEKFKEDTLKAKKVLDEFSKKADSKELPSSINSDLQLELHRLYSKDENYSAANNSQVQKWVKQIYDSVEQIQKVHHITVKKLDTLSLYSVKGDSKKMKYVIYINPKRDKFSDVLSKVLESFKEFKKSICNICFLMPLEPQKTRYAMCDQITIYTCAQPVLKKLEKTLTGEMLATTTPLWTYEVKKGLSYASNTKLQPKSFEYNIISCFVDYYIKNYKLPDEQFVKGFLNFLSKI